MRKNYDRLSGMRRLGLAGLLGLGIAAGIGFVYDARGGEPMKSSEYWELMRDNVGKTPEDKAIFELNRKIAGWNESGDDKKRDDELKALLEEQNRLLRELSEQNRKQREYPGLSDEEIAVKEKEKAERLKSQLREERKEKILKSGQFIQGSDGRLYTERPINHNGKKIISKWPAFFDEIEDKDTGLIFVVLHTEDYVDYVKKYVRSDYASFLSAKLKSLKYLRDDLEKPDLGFPGYDEAQTDKTIQYLRSHMGITPDKPKS
jgi:hypothetical protein